MPYQLYGQLVSRKSQRLLQAAGAVTAVGGGAFVTISAAVTAVSDVAMSNVETPAMLSEVRSMVVLRRQFTLLGDILAALRSCPKVEGDFASLFCELLRLGHNELVPPRGPKAAFAHNNGELGSNEFGGQ